MEEKEGDYGAFMDKFELKGATSSNLPLQGLTFAVKDIFDMEGFTTGFGNPDWARTHAPAKSTSLVVLATLNAGATCLGRTVMDEMAYSINGENKHYGTPINPCVPDRVPGGSSSGSAVAVAGKLVDFSLGTDTGGSVRVPAAYCGIFGFRPSHGIISTEKVIPMAQSFDTVGWFARDLQTLKQAGQVLLQLPPETSNQPTRISIPRDCFETLGLPTDKIYQIMNASSEKVYSSELIDNEDLDGYIYKNVPSMQKFISNYQGKEATLPALAAISHAMRLIQRWEFKASHEEWINATKPNFGPGIKERIYEALTANYDDLDLCIAIKAELKSALDNLLENCGLLAIPTVPGPPPKLLMDATVLENFRAKAFSLLSIAGMTGFCQINIPLGMHNNLPVSISLLAKHGSDMFLLSVAQELYATLKEQASIAWGSAS
ncbi:Glutamyl-tRNA(Gln) amidotransferase subunit A [Rhynchospora pubera]|uniref:Glutamyl-tRNA(Gln) amidotransferase subunit A n=1 Tax=Rhynchospora pubera TaxID=906938 RepID=A0AAV8CIP8_9POAL|nr:Glutamyl-tRNA(Gln) amidotransferase subunit A [Rhynchospora pubera]